MHLGVEVPERPARREVLNHPPVLLMAARFDPVKRHDLLIHATRRLRDQGVDVEVWLAGRGGQLEDEMKQLARRLGLDQNIRFQGFTPRATVLEWLESGQIDAVVLPSDGEGISVSLIEALAHCVPAVGTDVGGVGELLGDGCGELVPVGDADALAAGIARVLSTPELRERIAGAGRARIEHEFAVASVVRRLRELIRVRRRRHRRPVGRAHHLRASARLPRLGQAASLMQARGGRGPLGADEASAGRRCTLKRRCDRAECRAVGQVGVLASVD